MNISDAGTALTALTPAALPLHQRGSALGLGSSAGNGVSYLYLLILMIVNNLDHVRPVL